MTECLSPSRREVWYLKPPLSPLNSSIQRTLESSVLDTLKQDKIFKTVLGEILYLLAIEALEWTSLIQQQ